VGAWGAGQRARGLGGGWASSSRGLPGVVRWRRATSTGPVGPTWTTTTSSSRSRTQTTSPRKVCGTEYWPLSKSIIGVVCPTVRVWPNAGTNGWIGGGCSRVCSSASASAGARRVTRRARAFTCWQKSPQARPRSAKLW
jgi:hypothetical protein